MTPEALFLPILIPAVAGVLCLAAVKRLARAGEGLLVLATLANLVSVVMIFKKPLELTLPWGGFGVEFALRLDAFSSFILLAAASLSFLIAVYTVRFIRGKPGANQFLCYFLLTLAMANGAALSNHLITMLFFWEGMLLTLFGMIAVGHPKAYKTAVKAFFISGVTDLCMMVGVGLAVHLAHTGTISNIHLTTEGLGGLAFVMLMIGAISKAGAMPFHSWIPDAAVDAPLPFMALVPGSLEKLIGIYFLARISLSMFTLEPGWASTTLMVIGAVTILLAVLMALIQKDFKRLLSFHAISQVGYMILGIGTALPVGIVGGLFHTVNHAIYKSCLFLTGGAVEQQAGTTDLRKIGGLMAKMPITFACFVVAAFSISGFPLTNGFFSKELIYDGALARGWIFYAAALAGSFFTAASFLKLGHAAFVGPLTSPRDDVKEAPLSMLIPMAGLAGLCLFFGVFNALPLEHLVVPAVGPQLTAGHHFSGWPESTALVIGTLVVLAAAFLNHRLGVKASGSGLGALDHIHHAPVLHGLYDRAERRQFDPYELALKGIQLFAKISFWTDRAINFIYDRVATGLASLAAVALGRAHTGSHAMYLTWSVVGGAVVIFFLVGGY
jgi:NADH-quinone oxidoreductase subunit L